MSELSIKIEPPYIEKEDANDGVRYIDKQMEPTSDRPAQEEVE